MQIIELDTRDWKTVLDFYDALAIALGSPEGHGRGIAAFIDSMVWGGMNAAEPPYAVRISAAENFRTDIREEIELLGRCLARSRKEYRALYGRDVDVSLEIFRC